MAANIEESVIEKLRALPLEKQQEVLEFVENLAVEPATNRDDRPIWEVIKAISAEVPLEEWVRLPTDGAEQHDHYLYGAPKKLA
jgi:hypothetical protein